MCPRTYTGSARHFLATKLPRGLTQDVFRARAQRRANYRFGDRAQFRVRRLLATDEQAPTCSASCVRSPNHKLAVGGSEIESTSPACRCGTIVFRAKL